jgi:hypothetical protein
VNSIQSLDIYVEVWSFLIVLTVKCSLKRRTHVWICLKLKLKTMKMWLRKQWLLPWEGLLIFIGKFRRMMVIGLVIMEVLCFYFLVW